MNRKWAISGIIVAALGTASASRNCQIIVKRTTHKLTASVWRKQQEWGEKYKARTGHAWVQPKRESGDREPASIALVCEPEPVIQTPTTFEMPASPIIPPDTFAAPHFDFTSNVVPMPGDLPGQPPHDGWHKWGYAIIPAALALFGYELCDHWLCGGGETVAGMPPTEPTGPLQPVTPPPPLTPTPEPSSLVLLGTAAILGGAGMWFKRRRIA